MRPTGLFAVAVILFLSSGCSGDSQLAQPLLTAIPEAVLADLPPPLDKEVSAESTMELDGRDTVSHSDGATNFATALGLPAAEGELEWGIWMLALADRDRMQPVRLEVECGVLIGEKMYLAIGRPSTRSWEFFSEVTPGVSSVSFAIPPDGYVSQADLIHVAACAYDNNTGLVGKVRLVTENDTHYSVVHPAHASGATSLAIVAGRPAIAYQAEGALMYARASDAQGNAWGTPVEVYAREDLQSTGFYARMIVVHNTPAIAFHDSGDLNLAYVRALTSTGATWNAPVTVDAEELVGTWSSIQIVNGRPAICYFDMEDRDLRFVRASDSFGIDWETPQVLDSADKVGKYCSMAIVSSNPAICYWKEGPGISRIKYIRATDENGAAWGTPQELPMPWGLTGKISMLIVDSRPAAAYYNTSQDQLEFVRSNDALGNAWPADPVVVVGNGMLGTNTSMAIVDGRPAISYLDMVFDDLMFVQAEDTAGNSWGSPMRLDRRASTGHESSLTIVDGMPAVSYCNSDSGELMYARMIE